MESSGSAAEKPLQNSSSNRAPFTIPPLRSVRLESPSSSHSKSSRAVTAAENGASTKQTPLQRHLAHLARHGINGVSSAPGDQGNDSTSASSPRESLVNVNSEGLNATPTIGFSGASLASTSNLVSLSGSIKGRLSRFGSLNFGRRNAAAS
jgi:dedicator of cytokinesis protein 3